MTRKVGSYGPWDWELIVATNSVMTVTCGCGDVRCLGLGIERGDEHCHCDAREIAGMPGAWDRSLSEAPRAALRSLGAGWNLSSGRGDRYLQGLPTCSGPDVRVCCPLLLYIFIDSLQSFSHCLMTSS